MNLGDILRSIRTENKMTQKELADKLSISPSTIGMYEQNRRTPDIETLSKISSIFDVPIDELLGKQKDHSKHSEKYFFFFFDFGQQPIFLERIRNRLDELSISEEDFIAETNINIEEEMSLENLITIANTLKVSIDYLLGASDIDYISPEDGEFLQSLTLKERNFIDIFRKLNEDNQDIIIGDIKKYLKEQRYEDSVAADSSLRKTGTDNLGK